MQPRLLLCSLLLAATPSAADERAPHVLILGDSISIGYTPHVRDALKGEAVVIRPERDGRPINCQGTTQGVARVDSWLALGEGRWDVIYFNFGLHDMKRVDPATGAASDDRSHPRQAEPEVYERQLRQITRKLKASGARLIFATTTPVPPGVSPHRDVEDPERYNTIARKVMNEHGVAIDDLYAFARERAKQIQRPANVHFTPQGSEALGGVVVNTVRRALAERAAPKRPNIIFFLSDDQRDDLLGCAGHPILKTPVLDALAADGVRFTEAFVTTSICAASRATLLTGTYERTHKYTFGTPPIAGPLCETSYPTLLRGAGYRTGFVGKFGVGVPPGTQNDMFDSFVPLNRSPYFKKQPDGTLKHLTEITGEKAIEFIDRQDPSVPFCLSVSFNAPHAEDNDKENHYPFPPAMASLYEDVTIPPPDLGDPAIYESQPEFLKKSFNRVRYFWRWDTPEKWQKNVKDYFRMISGVDAAVGRVLDHLKAKGLADDTVVIYMSDNGYYLAERGFAGKWSHYEESLRVPLIIHDPRLPEEERGRLSDRMALNVDVAPTILELAGVRVPDVYQGLSLVGLVRDTQRPAWRQEFFCEHLMDVGAGIPKWEGVRGQRYVYANYFEQSPPYELLHDLEADPKQLTNLVGDPKSAAALEQMRRRCVELRDSYGGPYSREKFPTTRDR